ncbi:hypothetical protein IGI04_025698 [Brassica rapa subsp. trilocularis]|uniref:FH2 domain-containing protein n=1 Tax=Brassica rapa subsp. trilocularis TaxID=1813537 RepID=A0ABQ7KXS5_BRACM|nr:hypothetical protein IGI04_025698 [Brassica rapa subsp. trilocularis]
MLRRKCRDLLGEVKKYLASITSIKESPQKDLKSLNVKKDHECKDEYLAVFGQSEAITFAKFYSLFKTVFIHIWIKEFQKMVTRLKSNEPKESYKPSGNKQINNGSPDSNHRRP